MCVRFLVGFLSGQECPRYGLVPMSVSAAAVLRLRRLETFQRQFMTVKNFMVWSSVLVLGTGVLQAQTESVEQLKQQLKQANENFEKALQEQRRVIDDLTRRLQALEKQTNQPAAAAPTPAPEATPAVEPQAAQWSATNAITVARQGPNYINLSLDGLFAAGTSTERDVQKLQLGGHDPN